MPVNIFAMWHPFTKQSVRQDGLGIFSAPLRLGSRLFVPISLEVAI